MILLLELGVADLFGRVGEGESVRLAGERPGRGSGFLKQEANGSITDVYQSHRQLGLFIKPEARDPTCVPTLEQRAVLPVLGNLIKFLKRLSAGW